MGNMSSGAVTLAASGAVTLADSFEIARLDHKW